MTHKTFLQSPELFRSQCCLPVEHPHPFSQCVPLSRRATINIQVKLYTPLPTWSQTRMNKCFFRTRTAFLVLCVYVHMVCHKGVCVYGLLWLTVAVYVDIWLFIMVYLHMSCHYMVYQQKHIRFIIMVYVHMS
jgi:hypothetical protein